MGLVAPPHRLASAFFVFCGQYGDVSRYAHQRGVRRQWVYREAALLHETLAQGQQERDALRAHVQHLEQRLAEVDQQLATAVVLDEAKQAAVATVAQARGVSLRDCHALLEVLLPGKALSRATLGRRCQAASEQAGRLLSVFDALARPHVRAVAADEIYVKEAVLMTVEPESLCWLGGRLRATVNSAVWSEEWAALPHLEQVTRDGGKALKKGVALVNVHRQAQGQPPLVDQGDHFHALRGAGVGLRNLQAQAAKALAAAEAAQAALEKRQRQGVPGSTGAGKHAATLWRKAEQALDTWSAQERLWQQAKEALRLVTPNGALNSRAHAEAVLAETLPQLSERGFAKPLRQLQQPEMLNYLDRVQQKLAALPFPEAVKEAAIQQECGRRRPELLKGESPQAAARRGVLLLAAVLLGKAGEVGTQAVTAVREIFRQGQRSSSLVECVNSVLRMQQAKHRRLTQGLLDLKRLYWNCHRLESGRRRGTSPYERLGLPWPQGLRWWELLQLTPEQLRDKLSTGEKAE